MDEYYARDEADLSQEDLELRGRRKRRIGTVLLVLGFLAAAAALILTASNYRDDIEAGKSALADLHKMEEMLGIDADGDGLIGSTPIEDYYKAHGMDASERSSVRQEDVKNAPVYELHPDMTMPTVDADGHTYVGFLEIPAIKRILPVMDAWSYPNLKIAPCRFVGTVYAHDMIVCAHNDDRHFGLIKTLEEGDNHIK